jgi:hypothetical protein
LRYVVPFALLLVTLSAACSTGPQINGEIPPTAPPLTSLPPVTAIPTMLPTSSPLSFAAATYKDETNGFELDYPADWSVSPNTQIGSRGSQAGLYSPGASAENLPQGATRIGITIYQWDPKNDLTAYAMHRKTAWDAGGAKVLSETQGNLGGGLGEVHYTIQAPDGAQAFFLFTALGDQYLEISGEGNLALIEEIARTLRPLNLTP